MTAAFHVFHYNRLGEACASCHGLTAHFDSRLDCERGALFRASDIQSFLEQLIIRAAKPCGAPITEGIIGEEGLTVTASETKKCLDKPAN